MRNDNFLLNPNQCKKTILDKAYIRYINNLKETLKDSEAERWEIYQVILQILMDNGKPEYFNELKYRISDGENPNKIILDFIKREADTVDGFIWGFKKKLEEFIEEDYFKRFYE